MANGYTYGVVEGTSDTRDYLEKCARSRGFAIMQRDDAMSEPVKYREESDHHQKWYDEAVDKLAEWQSMDAPARLSAYADYVARIKESNRKYTFKAAKAAAACDDVIADIQSLDWPEELHGMRDDAIKWLEETKEFDGKAFVQSVEPFHEWAKTSGEMYRRSVETAKESLDRERKNVKETNHYIDLYHGVLEQLAT